MVLDETLQEKQQFVEALTFELQTHERFAGISTMKEGAFLAALQEAPFAVIAELKSKSPSEGVIKADYEPTDFAKAYVEGGAACISVLTDGPFFGGSFSHLQAVRKAVNVPLLCKDFIIDERQVYLAKKHGADAVLLIVRILTPEILKQLKVMVEALGMLAVIEVFDAADLEMALQVNPKVLLVNNRNLDSLKMDLNNTNQLLDAIPESVTVIAASGLTKPADVQNYPERVQAVLAGTMLMKSSEPATLIKEMIQCRA